MDYYLFIKSIYVICYFYYLLFIIFFYWQSYYYVFNPLIFYLLSINQIYNYYDLILLNSLHQTHYSYIYYYY